MKLTKEEFAIVSKWEMNILTAVRSKYLRNVGRSALDVLVPIYERATGTRRRVNSNCAACILEFLQRLGAIYFSDKAELEDSKTQEPKATGKRTRKSRSKSVEK